MKFAQVVGKKATLTIRRMNDDEEVFTRWVHGIVGRFQRVKRMPGGEVLVYRAVLVPEVAPLLYRTDCRIFQDMDMEVVVDEVVGLAGLGTTKEQLHTFYSKQPPPKRDYCVQYRESDWHFVERLLEEEGYYYFFIHEKDTTVLAMTNRANLPWPIKPKDSDSKSRVDFQLPTGQTPNRESIYKLGFSSEICPGQVHLDDYFFQQQNLRVQSTHTAKVEGDFKDYIPLDKRLEHHEYPGIYPPEEPREKGVLADHKQLIKNMATIRFQEQRVKSLQGQGESTCLRFVSGHHFSLTTAMDADVFDNKDYLLTKVEHHAAASQNIIGDKIPEQSHCSYDNTFACIPLSVPFRPARRTPKPAIGGVQTAVVVGPGKEEIYTDEFGRVKVMFRWDRQAFKKKEDAEKKKTDNASTADCSCWIRVSQPWAGSRWGAMFLPRVGHEVLVSFEEGDPDRPIITGSVYHATNKTPYDLPKHKTRSTIKSNSSPTGGHRSNEIRFEDKKGAEQLYIHAQTNMDEVVGHNHTRTVCDDEVITVQKGNRTVSVLKGGRTSYVEQSVTDTIKGDRTVMVTEGSDDKHILEGDHSTNITQGGHSLTVQKDSKKTIIEGNDETVIAEGKSILTVNGDRKVVVQEGEHVTIVRKKDIWTEVTKGDSYLEIDEGDHLVTIKEGKLKIECGKSHLEMKNDGTIELKGAGGSITIDKGGIKVDAGGKPVTIKGSTVDCN